VGVNDVETVLDELWDMWSTLRCILVDDTRGTKAFIDLYIGTRHRFGLGNT